MKSHSDGSLVGTLLDKGDVEVLLSALALALVLVVVMVMVMVMMMV